MSVVTQSATLPTTEPTTQPATGFSVRPLMPADVPAVHTMVRRCSAETLRRRFLGYRHDAAEALSAGIVDALPAGRVDVGVFDHRHGDLAGLASLIPTTGRLWEAALLVEDRWQRQGVGALLAETLLEVGRGRGIASVVAYSLPRSMVISRLAAGRATLAGLNRTSGAEAEYLLQPLPHKPVR